LRAAKDQANDTNEPNEQWPYTNKRIVVLERPLLRLVVLDAGTPTSADAAAVIIMAANDL
jgi:hypothetical protein